MEKMKQVRSEELYECAPGGVAKIVCDDKLSILEATDNFFSMIQTVKAQDEIKSLLEAAYSGDIIYINKQLAQQKFQLKNGLSLDFRILKSDGSFRWVLVSGNLMDEVYEEKYPIMACTIVDITKQKEKLKKLEEKESYNRITTDLARDLNFEYSIAEDTLYFSELFREVFGVDSIIKGFRDRLDKTKLIHHTELKAVKKIFDGMMGGKKQAIFELRMLPKKGDITRYRCYASIIFDENKNPFKLVGKLSVVLETIVNKTISKPVPVRIDEKSGLPDVSSTISLLSDAIIKQEDNQCSALMVIELCKYQELSQVMESISGNSMKLEFARMIKDCVRNSDIVGILGNDSYAILLKDISSVDSALQIADVICNKFRCKYQQRNMSGHPEIYIGLDFIKGHKYLYETYISNALRALETAKKSDGTNFHIHCGKM